jgi:hypothetical protein
VIRIALTNVGTRDSERNSNAQFAVSAGEDTSATRRGAQARLMRLGYGHACSLFWYADMVQQGRPTLSLSAPSQGHRSGHSGITGQLMQVCRATHIVRICGQTKLDQIRSNARPSCLPV